MRAIMVPVADRPECSVALNTTFKLAKDLGADVHGVHIRTHRNMDAKMPVGGTLRQFISERDPWEDVSEEEAETQSRSAQVLFQEMAANHGYELAKKPRKDQTPVALWSERVGKVEFVMPIIGPASDMLVVSRPMAKKKGGRKAAAFLTQALLNSQRPVLVLPQKKVPDLGGHVAIAWNKSAEASRALHAARPVIRSAKQVTFLTVGREDRIGPSAEEMANYLRHYGVKAERADVNKGDAGDELLKLYKDVGADLLVMGAYSRSRLSELVFGGATRSMLYDADIPVLMFHS